MDRHFLDGANVGNIELNEQKKNRQLILNRWEGLGMLEGLKGAIKENVAQLFESQAKQILREAVSADNSGSFETVIFPVIRRVFSKLLANDIVSVQAMNLPVGKLFFILPYTSEREFNGSMEDALNGEQVVGRHTGLMGYERTDLHNGSKYNRFYLPDEAVANMKFKFTDAAGEEVEVDQAFANYDEALSYAAENSLRVVEQTSPSVTKYYKRTLYDLFYNDFLFDNSKGKVRIKVGSVEPVAFSGYELVPMTDALLKPYADGSIRNIILKVKGFSNVNPGKLTGPDGNEMDSEAFLASLKVFAVQEINNDGFACFEQYEGIPARVVTQRYGHGIVENGVDGEGCIYLDIDLAKPVKKQGATIDGYIGIQKPASVAEIANMFKVAWSQYDSLELETEIGEVGFTLTSVTVSVTSRKLRATWSPEMAQDVSAFHNIDAEAELTALLSEQIAGEIDREILRDLRTYAPWQLRWDVNGWRRMAGFSTNYTQKDWNQELMTKINQISAQIHKSTLRGGANFVVVSSMISAIFDNLEYFHVSDASAESDMYNMGIERIGALQNRYQVYRDPYAPEWSIIVGHKGKSLLDTGYIYAPYIPLQLTPTQYNYNNFAPVKGIMTRYAKKCVNGRFYGGVKVDGVTQWNPQELR